MVHPHPERDGGAYHGGDIRLSPTCSQPEEHPVEVGGPPHTRLGAWTAHMWALRCVCQYGRVIASTI